MAFHPSLKTVVKMVVKVIWTGQSLMVLYPLISKFNGGYTYLVGGLEHLDDFSIYWEWWSQLTFIFFRGVGQSPTRLHCRCKRPCSQGLLHMFPPAFCSLPLARSWRVHRRHHKEVPAARGWNVRFFREYDLQIYKHWLVVSNMFYFPSYMG
jgi:hypothetical protein